MQVYEVRNLVNELERETSNLSALDAELRDQEKNPSRHFSLDLVVFGKIWHVKDANLIKLVRVSYRDSLVAEIQRLEGEIKALVNANTESESA